MFYFGWIVWIEDKHFKCVPNPKTEYEEYFKNS